MAEIQDSAKPEARLSTPLLATIITVGAVLAAGAAFFVTSTMLNNEPSAAEVCAASKAEILAVKAAFPDSSKLGAGEDARLNAAATELRNTCTYTAVVEFESIEVFPWLGIDTGAPAGDPNAAPTDGATPPATDSTAPATVPSSAPTESAPATTDAP
jgi:hypothetical protein